jgi:hypothetical protein
MIPFGKQQEILRDLSASIPEELTGNCRKAVYPSCAENPAVQGGDVERGERSSPCAKIFS